MINREALPPNTRFIFDLLAKDHRLSNFVLIGGTALALQKGHRLSEDLDFWLPAESLNKKNIFEVIESCINRGIKALLVTPQSKIIAAKINGLDLLSGVQDYVIGGVKVTFLARNDMAYRRFAKLDRFPSGDTSFKIMSADGIFTMKSHLIHCRIRSRDLFDLMTFVKDGKSLEDILQAGVAVDPSVSVEYAKSVLRGDLPVDKEDEGFAGVEVRESIADIYRFFSVEIDEYEQQIAARRINEVAPPGY